MSQDEAQSAPAAPSTPPARPSGRLGDLARLLPIFGAFLLVSPLVRVFAAPASPGGVPLIVWYIFGVWGALIVASVLLGRRFRAIEESDRAVPLSQDAARGGEEGVER